MSRSILLIPIAASLALLSLRISAHHSLEDVYDMDRSIVLTGLITRSSWTNPHAAFVLDVEDEAGARILWAVEMAPPHALMRRGLSPDIITDGQLVRVEGNPGLDGLLRMNAATLTLPNGETLDVEGSSWMQSGR